MSHYSLITNTLAESDLFAKKKVRVMISWLNGRLFTGLQHLQYMMWLSSIIDCFDFWRPTASTCCWCLAVPKKNITNSNRKNMFQAQMMFLKLQTALLNILQNLVRLSRCMHMNILWDVGLPSIVLFFYILFFGPGGYGALSFMKM